jgi:molybdate-binding protein
MEGAANFGLNFDNNDTTTQAATVNDIDVATAANETEKLDSATCNTQTSSTSTASQIQRGQREIDEVSTGTTTQTRETTAKKDVIIISAETVNEASTATKTTNDGTCITSVEEVPTTSDKQVKRGRILNREGGSGTRLTPQSRLRSFFRSRSRSISPSLARRKFTDGKSPSITEYLNGNNKRSATSPPITDNVKQKQKTLSPEPEEVEDEECI